MTDDKRTKLIENIREAVSDKKTEPEILQTAIELIDSFSEDFNWTGFYMVKDGSLHVGPYIGPVTEHTKIEFNSGICGAAVSQKKTLVVDDVKADPRFLACSLTTRSEIVVPLMDGNECIGEIDIDSNKPAFFTGDDKIMLEKIAEIIVARLKSTRGTK